MTTIKIDVPADEQARFEFFIEEVRKGIASLVPNGMHPWEIVIPSHGKGVHCQPMK